MRIIKGVLQDRYISVHGMFHYTRGSRRANARKDGSTSLRNKRTGDREGSSIVEE
jgi:hypothetical protein